MLAGCSPSQPPAPAESSAPQKPSGKSIDPATAATISGVVKFDGPAPKRAPIEMGLDANCEYSSKEPNLDERVIVQNGDLVNVFVYVKTGLAGYASEVPKEAVVLDQQGCRYRPHVLGMVAGQTLRILNSDITMHNVHPEPAKNRAWNVTQMPKGKPVETTFEQPELLVPLVCNQHNWMKMYVNVVSSPFFAVTGPDGSFRISGLPPGEYTLVALHEKLGSQEIQVKVGAKESKSDVAFHFKPAQP